MKAIVTLSSQKASGLAHAALSFLMIHADYWNWAALPAVGSAHAEIKVPSVQNTELEGSSL